MNFDKIRRLIDLVQTSDVDEVEVTHWIVHRVRITRRGLRPALTDAATPVYAVPPAQPAPVAFVPPLAPTAAVAAAPAAATAEPESAAPAPAMADPPPAAEETPSAVDPKLGEIVSPIVGTFYAAPSPNADLFVRVGSKVKKDSVVCIVEAMKIMNEIEAELEGEIVECLVSDGDPIEFNQALFRVRKT